MEERFLPTPATTGGEANWTKDENKMFESALAVYDEDTPDRWIKVAALIPGKSSLDVENKYRELLEDVMEIEAGWVSIPGYGRDFEGCRKGPSSDRKRKKEVPWTEEEHRRFLMGLLKYGKGGWRNISRNFVISRTPMQVASHAQKYFIRQLSCVNDKRRLRSIERISCVDFQGCVILLLVNLFSLVCYRLIMSLRRVVLTSPPFR